MSTEELIALANKIEDKLAMGNTLRAKQKLTHALELARALNEAAQSPEENVTRHMLGIMADKISSLINDSILSLDND